APLPAGPRPPTAGVWTSAAELASRPQSGPAWQAVKSAADGSLGTPAIANQDSDHDVLTQAVALVYARTGAEAYRSKAAAAISAAIGTERGGRTLALGRNLVSYVIAADLIGLGGYDPALDARFRAWLASVRTEALGGDTLVSTQESRPNNWGTMAGASRMAADVYLGDTGDLDRAATAFQGWLGDRRVYAGFSFGDLSWQADPSQPVGIDPPGAVKQGLATDGALPDDMRRGCAFALPPCHTNYAWEAMQGVVVAAEILARRGYDSFGWSDRAVLRAAQFLDRLDHQYGGWWATADDTWQPWLINSAYGTRFPATSPAGVGKIMAWTDWVFGA
ncbi:MAG: alginate lyase family protein, partial [Actinomycetota bacterium]|nr:alginate lyase family protein [Actinomycetota bacterium]